VKYTIKKGSHSSGFRFCPVVNKKQMSVLVKFDVSCRYELQGEDQKDWNKLFGWSYLRHQDNSVRVVWRYNENRNDIEVAPYLHSRGKIIFPNESQIICIAIDCFTCIDLIDTGDQYLVITDMGLGDNTEVCSSMMPLNGIRKFPVGYKLYPYFGGNQTAPHDINIFMEEE
jgi:hypothetical protein